MAATKRFRDRGGRYDVQTMDRVCVCGHRLGEHAASRPGEARPCFACEASGGDCETFRADRRKKNPAAKALDKKALWKTIERDQREAERKRIAELAAAAKASCRSGREATRERVREMRAKAKIEASARADAMRAEQRGACELAAKGVKDAKRERAAFQRAERANRERGKAAPKVRAAVRRSESDDEVRANISPELVPLFERVKRSIRGSARESRTEAFLRYVEEHPREVYASTDDAIDSMIVAREAELRRGAVDDFPFGANVMANQKRNPKARTFKDARAEILEYLRGRGWEVAASLKVPHATPPGREFRVWFEPQAVYLAAGNRPTRGGAHSMGVDIRNLSGRAFEVEAYHRAGASHEASISRRQRDAELSADLAEAERIRAEQRARAARGGWTAGEIVRLVDRSFAHQLPLSEAPFAPDDRGTREALAAGWIARLPARGRWKDRYVVTATGSHVLGTFAFDDPSFRDDAIEAGHRAAAKKVIEAERRATKTSAASRTEQMFSEPENQERVIEKSGQVRMFNPAPRGGLPFVNPAAGELVSLGALTSIVYRDGAGKRRELRWGLLAAPILAYHVCGDRRCVSEGKLAIVYRARGVRAGASSAFGAREYKRTHWGDAGKAEGVAGDVLAPKSGGELVTLGKVERLVYTTRKGGDASLTDYVHDMGEGGRGRFVPPVVAQERTAPRGSAPRLLLLGGSYRVESRGIVG